MEESIEDYLHNYFNDVKRRLEKSNKFLLYFSIEDIQRLVNIIESLEDENKYKSKYIKELEKLNLSTTKSYLIYSEGDVIINANNDND